MHQLNNYVTFLLLELEECLWCETPGLEVMGSPEAFQHSCDGVQVAEPHHCTLVMTMAPNYAQLKLRVDGNH
jgi:hypothetical protein